MRDDVSENILQILIRQKLGTSQKKDNMKDSTRSPPL